MKRKKRSVIKCIISFVLTTAMVFGAVPLPFVPESMVVHAEGDTQTIEIEATNQTVSDETTWENCVVNITGSSTVTYSERIIISGEVTLNLGEGTTLKADKGIEVHEGDSLTIDGSGQLDAKNDNNDYRSALIGGSDGHANAGTIIINGGTINATSSTKNGGGYAAAIGGGYDSSSGLGGTGGTITINSGTVTAKSDNNGYGAAIGGGKTADGGSITINGGTVNATARGNAYSAAIGGGRAGSGGSIHITDGTVTATGGKGSAIGGGNQGLINDVYVTGSGGEITISGGNVTAKGYTIGIGSGGVSENGQTGSISITGGVINASSTYHHVGIGGSGGTISISGGQVMSELIGAKEGSEGVINLSWTESADFIQASSYAGSIQFASGKRFYYDNTTEFATAAGLYKQNKKIVSAQADNKYLDFSEIRMPRYYVTTVGTSVNVSYEVYDYNGNKLTKDTDYTAVIKNSSDEDVTTFDHLDDYTLMITGTGDYAGSNSYTFSLVDRDPSLTEDNSEYYVNFPNPGRKTVSLGKDQTIKVYDSEGKNGNFVACDGFLIFYAPEGCVVEVTGKTDAIVEHSDGTYSNYVNAYDGDDETSLITSVDRNSESISFASSGNRMLLRFNAPKTYAYSNKYGLDLTVSAVPVIAHNITVGTAEHGSIESDKSTANRNESVTLTVSPENGYLLKNITVKETGTDNVIETIGTDQWCSGGSTFTYTIKDKDVTFVPEFTDALTGDNLTLSMKETGTNEYVIPDSVISFRITGSAYKNSNTTAIIRVDGQDKMKLVGSFAQSESGRVKIYDGTDTSANLLLENNTDVSIDKSSSSNCMTIWLESGSTTSSLTGTITLFHTHEFAYSADGATITAICSGGRKCSLTDRKATLTINPPEELTYNHYPHMATITGDTAAFSEVLGAEPVISYTRDGESVNFAETFDAGNYTASVTIGGAKASIEYTIAKAELSNPDVKITGWIYGDAANKPITSGAMGSNVTYEYKVKDAADSTYSTTAPTAAGDYTVRATVSESMNYNGKKVTKDFTIAKKAVTVTAKEQSVEVGGTLSQDASNATLSGALDGHALTSIKLTPSSVEGVGTGSITASEAHIKNGSVDVTDNYSITYMPGKLTVTKKQITVSGIKAKGKIYDGTTNAELDFSDAVLSGAAPGAKLSVTAQGEFSDKNVGTGKTVTISGLTLTGDDAGNYELALTEQQLTATATITKKTVAITGLSASNKDYDGKKTAIVTGKPGIDGKVNSDDVSIVQGSASFEDANAGAGKTVTFSGYSLTGTDAGNYVLSGQPASVKANIDKADTSMTIGTASFAKTYGDTEFTLTGISTTPVDASLTYTVSDSKNAADTSVDNDKVITVDENGKVTIIGAGSARITVDLLESQNYNAALSKTIGVTVGRAANPGQVVETASVIKGGNTVGLSSNVSNAQGSVSYSITSALEGCTVDEDTGVFTSGNVTGDCTVTVTISGNENYNGTTAAITIAVTDKQVQTISFESNTQTKTYGDEDFTVTATCSVGDGAVSYAVTEGTDVATVDNAGKVHILKAGTATIKATAAETNTYAIATAQYTLTVNPKAVTIPAAVTDLKWTGAEQTGVSDGADYTVTDGKATDVGSYTATAALKDKANTKWSNSSTDDQSILWSIAKADGPAAPTGLTGTAPTTDGGSDGKISGVDSTMEYSDNSGFTSKTECSGTEITGLAAGTYYVRVKETGTHEAGTFATVKVPAYYDVNAKVKTIPQPKTDTKTDNPGADDPGNKNTDGNDPGNVTPNEVPADKGTTIMLSGDDAADYVVTSEKGETPAVAFVKPNDGTGKKVVIPDTVTKDNVTYEVLKIADNAFKDDKTLETVVVGKNIKEIGNNAFVGCSNLKSVDLSKAKIEIIGKNAFKGTKLKTVIMPDTVKNVKAGAFSNCRNMTSLTFGQNTTIIGKGVVKNSGKLKTIILRSDKVLSVKTLKALVKSLKNKKATIKVKKSLFAKYKAALKKAGFKGKLKKIK